MIPETLNFVPKCTYTLLKTKSLAFKSKDKQQCCVSNGGSVKGQRVEQCHNWDFYPAAVQ